MDNPFLNVLTMKDFHQTKPIVGGLRLSFAECHIVLWRILVDFNLLTS